MLNEIQFANIKAAISEGGHARPDYIIGRLNMGATELAAWLRQPAINLEIDEDIQKALEILCAYGWGTKFADYVRLSTASNRP